MQQLLGADIQMVLDVCPPRSSPPEVVRPPWSTAPRPGWSGPAVAHAARAAGSRQALFGIVQGGVDPALRAESVARTVELGFDGYGIGGLSVGERRGTRCCPHSRPLFVGLPADRPRYLMGVGDPIGLVEGISARGSTCSTASCPPAWRGTARSSPTPASSTCATPSSPVTLNRSTRPARAPPAPGAPGRTCATCCRCAEATVLRLLTIHNVHWTRASSRPPAPPSRPAPSPTCAVRRPGLGLDGPAGISDGVRLPTPRADAAPSPDVQVVSFTQMTPVGAVGVGLAGEHRGGGVGAGRRIRR